MFSTTVSTYYTSAILPGAHSYFLLLPFKSEGKVVAMTTTDSRITFYCISNSNYIILTLDNKRQNVVCPE
jgi:hypothetical protein